MNDREQDYDIDSPRVARSIAIAVQRAALHFSSRAHSHCLGDSFFSPEAVRFFFKLFGSG